MLNLGQNTQLGATGSGKTYLACALGMAAARQFLPVKYVRLPDLLVDFSIARGNGTIRKLMAQYKKYALLIIDEWLLMVPTPEEQKDILELLHRRRKKSSVLVIILHTFRTCAGIVNFIFQYCNVFYEPVRHISSHASRIFNDT